MGVRDMTPEQCRAARECLGWSQEDLADRAGCTDRTVRSFERGATVSGTMTAIPIRIAFLEAGVDVDSL